MLFSRMKKLGLSLILVFSLVFLSLSAVAQDDFDDVDITTAVSQALLNDPGVAGYQIDVSTNNGIVTLSGTANNILAKDRATRIVKTVKGVRAMVNNIDVMETNREDSEIRNDIITALAVDPATESWEIDVSVQGGMANISGTVDSWQEKQLAEKIVKGVWGVLDVENNITINYVADRSDEEIEAEIEETLAWDALVDHAMIEVEVTDGEVMLSGVVGSAAEKTEAYGEAWVAGVTDVDDAELNVASWAREPKFRTDKYVNKSDSAIRDAVLDAMVYDPRVNSFNVDVSVENGIVSLTGIVNNLKAKRAAARDARNTVGVWRVKNYIVVRPSTPTDEEIEQSIEEALLRDPYVSRYEIIISVVNKEAYLYGTVDTYFEKAQAEDVAARIYGVVEVNNNLDVDDDLDPLTYDPYVDYDWYIYDYDWYTRPEITPTKSDWEILEDINDELFWSPFVDSDEVTVTVDNGVATLTGTVDTWNERFSATENAFEGGAVAVDNDLTVKFGPEYYE